MAEPRSLVRRGLAHVLGDDVTLDDGIIPARFAVQRVLDPALLTPHLFETVDAGFAGRARRGDIVFAGRRFASGKPRLQGFIAMGAMELSVVCGSMPYKMLRRAVARATPVMVGAPKLDRLVMTGDEVEVDFSDGTIWNITTNRRFAASPMPEALGAIVSGGGMQAMLRDWLAAHPEQAIAPA